MRLYFVLNLNHKIDLTLESKNTLTSCLKKLTFPNDASFHPQFGLQNESEIKCQK